MARSAVAAPRGPISCGSIRREPDHFKRSFLRGPRMKFEPTHVGCYGSKGGDRWRGRRWRLVEVPNLRGHMRREAERLTGVFSRAANEDCEEARGVFRGGGGGRVGRGV